jgi:outer membrane murein-binding lipoprotein Lpp
MFAAAKGLLSFAKFLPILILVAGAAYSYYNYMMNQKDSRINQLQSQVDQLNTENVTLRAAAQINENTINQLNNSISEQNQRITTLTNNNNQLTGERDQYLSIFRRHDLTKLSLGRPGLIQNRINSGTADIFRTLELDTVEKQINESQ